MSDDITKLVGRILGSTKRKKRALSIIEIASDIRSLKEKTGSVQAVAKLIGISPGMINQFLSVFNLPAEVQDLIKDKKIDSVAMVFTLSKFDESDIRALMEPIIQNKITSQDLKVLLPFRRQHKKESILDLLERVNKSKNVKVSIIRLPKNIVTNREKVEDAIKMKIGEDNFVSTDEVNEFIDITITKEGEKIIRQSAKINEVTLQQYILTLLQYAR